MSYETSDGTLHIAKTDVRGGRRVKSMPWILGISTAAAVVLLAIAFVSFA